ncbi:aldo/keto reductase [Lactobacillus agrestimuris]|uniref:aldo/keto reductase n=1 Tax=Lactobacillus agrestimuris TaxID=2941328 RepID=UPI0020433DB9|nr:aldo/keto reductase [Lactobacillus agrestimuris]
MVLHSLEDTYTLANGVEIPVIGFGTWQTPSGQVAEDSVLAALNAGYRHIDTAAAYGNEESVGNAIKKSGVNRHDLFVTTKLWNKNHGYKQAKAAIDESLQKLGLDYLDLYLIHWPNPVDMRDNWAEMNAESWQAMEEAQRAGKIRALGISNFRKHHIDELMKTAEIKPVVNQNYLNPSDLQPELVAYDDKLGMLNEAYSPLGTGGLLGNDTVNEVAKNHGKSPAQVLIRWSLQHGFLPLPKSVHPEYIKANAEVFDFELSDAEMKQLDSLRGAADLAADPDKTDF